MSEAFHARLNLHHPGGPKLREFRLAEVGLHLVEETEIARRFNEPRDERVERPSIQDVVGSVEVQALIPSRQVQQLVEDAVRVEPAEGHRRSVQAAEAAVVLLAPPASA